LKTSYPGKAGRSWTVWYPAAFLTAILYLPTPCPSAFAQQAPAPTLALSQMTAQQLESRGDAFRSQKDLANALDAYNRAVAKAPKNAVLWNKIGMTQLVLGASATGLERNQRYDDARRSFERAVKLKSDYAEAVNNLGVVYYQREDYKKAINQYRKAIAIRDSASFHSNLGSVYFVQKKFDDAMREYLQALQLDSDVFERTSVNGLLGRVSTPVDRAKYAIMLAKLYARVGDVDHALIQIRTALENGYSEMEPLYKDEEFAAVRKDPRFAELMQNKPVSLPE